jgi:hypothetical protein
MTLAVQTPRRVGHAAGGARGQCISNLDLSKPAVAAYLEETTAGLVERYRLDCFRLDYNLSVGEGGEAQRGGYTENVLWRYYDALYGILDRVHRSYRVVRVAGLPRLQVGDELPGGGEADVPERRLRPEERGVGLQPALVPRDGLWAPPLRRLGGGEHLDQPRQARIHLALPQLTRTHFYRLLPAPAGKYQVS